MGKLTTDVRHHVILGTPNDGAAQDEYRVTVSMWYNGDVDINIGVHYGLDEQDEPVFYTVMILRADSMSDMLRWMPTHVKRLLSPELCDKLSRILAGENVVR